MMDNQELFGMERPVNIFELSDDKDETILHRIVRIENVDHVKKVMDSGALLFINSLDGKSRSPVHIAIEEKLDEVVKLFMSTYKDLISDNQYLIHYAIVQGNIEIVKLLVEHFSVEVKNQENKTAFCVAVNEDRFDILEYLLNLRKNVKTSSNNYNDHALFYVAIIAGNIELVKKFLESNFPINDSLESSPDGWRVLNDHAGFTPLHLAVQYLRLDIVELLLSKGADVLKQNEFGSTALHIAFETKTRGIWKTWQDVATNDKIIDTILDVNFGTSVKLTNRHGISHLHIACSRDRPEVIENFLQENHISGNDFACYDDQGFSSLHFAAKYKCHKIAKVILRCDINVNQRDDEYRTPLHIASKETSLELVQLLMQHGADLSLKDCHGNTPVHLAFNERNYAVIDLLLTDHTTKNSNPTDSVGISHFHIACTRNAVSLVRDFIDAAESIVNLAVPTSDFKIKYCKYNKDLDWRGCVPLHFAAAFNRVKIIELLLMYGADVHRKDAKGLCPIHSACQQNYDRFGDLIKENLENWKKFSSVQPLEWMSVQMQNRPYSDVRGDVTSVDEEIKAKTSDPNPRRFPAYFSQFCTFTKEELDIIDWRNNRREQIDMIALLVRNGANMNVVDNFGNAPLYYIYDFNIHKILDVLDQKINLDKRLWTLIVRTFLLEIYLRRLHLLEEIFKFGVNINLNACYNNCSILHYICQENESWNIDRVSMTKYFLEKNANPDVTDELRLTPALISIDNLDDVNVDHFESRNHLTPLHIATKCRPSQYNLEIIKHLLEANANVNAKQTDGMTPLHNLSLYPDRTYDHQEMIRVVLKYNARFDSRDNRGRTPLFLACLSQNYVLVKTLLHQGTDVNIEDYAGQTVFCYFYEKHIRRLGGELPRKRKTLEIADHLVQHVQEMKEVGLWVSQKVVDSTLNLHSYLMSVPTTVRVINEGFEAELKKQVEKLKNTKVNSRISLYDVIFINEYFLSRKLMIEQLEKIIYSTESYIDIIPSYFYIINNKYNLAVERKGLLQKAKHTLNCLLSTSRFPEVCSDIIFMHLTNFELADFIKAFAHLTKYTTDNSKIKAYLKIRSAISKYVILDGKNAFVIDLIIRRM